jgi:Tol biopolymer transport system component
MASGVVLPSGHLLFQRDRSLLAQRLDLGRLVLADEPVVLSSVVGLSSVGQLAASASENGVLVFAPDMSAPGQLTWFDRQGKVDGTVGPLADNMDFELSPDDRRLLISRAEAATADVWLADLVRGNEERLTTGNGLEASAVWDPTGGRVAFRSNSGGVADTYMKDVASTAPERLIFRGSSTNPTSWSSDGGQILYNESSPDTGWDVYRFTFAANATEPFIRTPANELHGRFSPDGEWIYSSDESGRWEVYVRPANRSGERVLVSTNGGFEPRWRGDSKEIFYVTAERRIMAAAVTSGAALHVSSPQAIITAQIDPLPTPQAVSSGYRKSYTVTRDGQRFLVNVLAREQNTQTMTAILNWPALLRNTSGRK